MADFLIYLLESSMCLSLLYIGYVFLFRKETYFNFIRLYLIITLILAVSIPLISVNLTLTRETVNEPIVAIDNFKNYYEQIIYMTDPSYAFDLKEELGTINNKNLSESFSGWLSTNGKSIRKISRIVLFFYFLGFGFFVLRFFYLLIWLILLIRKHGVIKYKGLKLVQIDKEMPSFSFLGYLFVNRSGLSESEFQQVIAHEKTHIHQWHSIDLLLVNIVTLFQWFNPLVWRLQKAFKTTHEYIADRKVVEQGYELLDYQSLLLRQLVSIRSVELVNNFNLLSIKKRIAMMNKINSGFLSRLKALVAIPFIAFAFIALADMSCDMAPTENESDKFKQAAQALPEINQAMLIQEHRVSFTISIFGDDLYFNQNKIEFSELSDLIQTGNESESPHGGKNSVLLRIDKTADMNLVHKIKQVLRENEAYKILYQGNSASADEIVALPQKLPPKEVKFVDIEEIQKNGISIYYMRTFENSNDLNAIQKELKAFILQNEKYVFVLEYDNKTSYETYISFNDLVYDVIRELRDEYSLNEYGKSYKDLEHELQKQVRKVYPITLTQKNIDVNEN